MTESRRTDAEHAGARHASRRSHSGTSGRAAGRPAQHGSLARASDRAGSRVSGDTAIVCDHSPNRHPSPRFPRRSPLKFRLAAVAVVAAATATVAVAVAVAVQIDRRRRDDVAASSLKRDTFQRVVLRPMSESKMMQENADDHSSKAVLLNTFVVKKKRCRVYFHRGTLIWETERPPYTRWTLPLTDVLAVRYGDDWIPGANIAKEKQQPAAATSPNTTVCPTNFILHYAVRGAKNKWRHHSVTMSHTDPRQVASWVKTIRNYLLGLTHRPRKVMLFVNPIGGKKKGLKIWEKDVQPLMTIAGIETKMMVTERAGHIRDTLLTADLSDLHALVCIGGDGTFAEVFNGLVLKTAKDQQIDPNDPDARLPNPELPIGVIPSGSTDTLAYSLHGTTDVQTAAIHIIFGDSAGLDVSSVHTNRTLLRLYASVLSYGYLGDVIRDSEKFRWMGPQRYDYSGFKKIIANKGYEGEIELLSDPCHPASSTRCMKNCSRCLQHMHNSVPDEEMARWVTVRGKFFMVNGANVSCACSRTPMGFSPHCHIGDGCVDIILVRHTSLINNIRMLLRLSSKRKTVYDLPFVEVYRARQFTFRALPTMHLQSASEVDVARRGSQLSVWNCDGEVIDSTNVKIRVHCQLLKVYTRRAQEPVQESTCFCAV